MQLQRTNYSPDRPRVPPNLRLYVYKYGMLTDGSETDWNFLWNRYRTETVPQERVNLMYALAHTKNVWLLNRSVQETVSFEDRTRIIGDSTASLCSFIFQVLWDHGMYVVYL